MKQHEAAKLLQAWEAASFHSHTSNGLRTQWELGAGLAGHSPPSDAHAAVVGIRKGQRETGSAVRNSVEILCRQENSKALKPRMDFI